MTSERYRINYEDEFGDVAMCWIEEKTSFGWERVYGTTAFTEKDSWEYLKEKRGLNDE